MHRFTWASTRRFKVAVGATIVVALGVSGIGYAATSRGTPASPLGSASPFADARMENAPPGQTTSPAPTPSGTPTPTATSQPPANASGPPATASGTTVCSGLTPGSYDPSATTTGVKPGSQLTVHEGNLTIKAAGTYANLDVHGFVSVEAADVTILNSRVRGGVATGSRGLINATHVNVKNLVVDGVQLSPDHPSLFLDGIRGHDYTARCLDVSETVDGFGVFPSNNPGAPVNVKILQSWCHDLSYYSPDPGHADNQTHNDCIQLQGGSNIEIRYNTLDAYLSTTVGSGNIPAGHPQALSTLMLNCNVGKTTNITVTDNLLRGGAISVNGGGGLAALTSADYLGSLLRNRFDRGQYLVGHTIDLRANVRADTGEGTANQNTYTDGTPVTVRHNG